MPIIDKNPSVLSYTCILRMRIIFKKGKHLLLNFRKLYYANSLHLLSMVFNYWLSRWLLKTKLAQIFTQKADPKWCMNAALLGNNLWDNPKTIHYDQWRKTSSLIQLSISIINKSLNVCQVNDIQKQTKSNFKKVTSIIKTTFKR